MLTLGAGVSLVLFVAVVGLGARSYRVGDEVYALGDRRGYYLEACRGSVMYFTARTPTSRGRGRMEWGYMRHKDTAAQARNIDAIEANVAERSGNGFRALGMALRGGSLLGKDATVVILPLWPVAGLLALLPAAWVRRRRRLKQGMCRTCGYDLRASKLRCPECGTGIPDVA